LFYSIYRVIIYVKAFNPIVIQAHAIVHNRAVTVFSSEKIQGLHLVIIVISKQTKNK